MEERSGKEALVLALVVWRGEVDFRCLWRSRQSAMDWARRTQLHPPIRRKRFFMDATRSVAWSTFWAWHQATQTLKATASHAPQPLPTLLGGPATQFVQHCHA